MEKVMLICNGGMSTSIMARQIREASEGRYDVEAWPESVFSEHLDGVRVILVAPQIRFMRADVQRVAGPERTVEVMDMQTYGRMDGKRVLKLIDRIYAERGL